MVVYKKLGGYEERVYITKIRKEGAKMISGKNVKKIMIALLFAVAMMAWCTPERIVFADEYDSLRDKWIEYLTGGTAYDVDDEDIAAQIAAINRATLNNWSSMNGHHVWDDLEASSAASSGDMAAIYGRLYDMTLGWATTGSEYYHNPNLLNDIIAGMDWMYQNRFNEGSSKKGDYWFAYEMVAPKRVCDITLILKNNLTSTQISNYLKGVNKSQPSYLDNTGANMIYNTRVWAVWAIIEKDSARMWSTHDGLESVLPYVTKDDGFYTDGSFIQHYNYSYAGGYGAGLFNDLSPLLWFFEGTTWQIDSPDKDNVHKWVLDTFEPNLFQGQMIHLNRQREMSRYDRDTIVGTSDRIIQGLTSLVQLNDAQYADNEKSMIKYHVQNSGGNYYNTDIWYIVKLKSIMNDAAVTPRPVLTGNYQFYNQDTVVHRRPGWLFGLQMHSSRIKNSESGNLENLHGWYLSDGMTYLYENPTDYLNNYMWTVDPHRLPGTTVDRLTTRANKADAQYQDNKGLRDFAGGVVFEDSYGVSGMDFQQHGYAGMDLNAKKSWFMFDNSVVALGADINSTSGRNIETIIENRALNSAGDNTLTVNGTVKPAAAGWSETMNGVNWVHLDGTGGYYFPQGASLQGLREKRSGQTYEVNRRFWYKDDNFNSTVLQEGWRWVREDAAKWSLPGTVMRLNTQMGTLASTVNSTKNLLIKTAPRGDFYVTAKLSFAPTETGHEAGLMIYTDDDNYVYVSRAKTSAGSAFQAVSEISGTTVTNSVYDTIEGTAYLKIEKSGNVYSMYASGNGTDSGTAIAAYTYDGAVLNAGIFAQNGEIASTSITADFDDVNFYHTNHFLTMWADHGIDPDHASYSYVLLPGMTSGQVAGYAANPQVSIIENSASVQAVKNTALNLTGAVVWDTAGDQVDYISVGSGAALMSKDSNGEISIAVSDPTHKQSSIIVELHKTGISTISQDPEVTVLQLAPTIKFKVNVAETPGKTFHAKFSYDHSAAGLVPNAPTGVEATTAAGTVQLAWDANSASVGGAATYNVYRSGTVGSGYEMIASGLTGTGYTDHTVQPGTNYGYVVTAVNSYGESSFSNEQRYFTDIEPEADSYVRAGTYANQNYGTSTTLDVKYNSSANNNKYGFMRFNLENIGEHIESAKLYIYAKQTESSVREWDLKLYEVRNDQWSETGVKYTNMPALSNLLATVNVENSEYRWKEIDVTDYIRSQAGGDKKASFGFYQDTGKSGVNIAIHSKENSMNKPYLKIVYASNLVYDDFNYKSTGSEPQGWTVVNDSNTSNTIQEMPSSTDKSMKLYDSNNAGKTTAKKLFAEQSGILTAEWKFKEATAGKWTKFYLSGGSADAAGVEVSSSGPSLIYRDSSGSTHKVQNVSSNTWYKVKLVVDVPANTYDIYVDDVLKVSAAPFQASVSVVDNFRIETGDGPTGVVAYVDDVKIR
jgi:hypothetical protein